MRIHRCPVLLRWVALNSQGAASGVVKHHVLVIEHDDGTIGWLREWKPTP